MPDDRLKLSTLINVFFLGSGDICMFAYLKKSMSSNAILIMLQGSAAKRGLGSLQSEYLSAMSNFSLEVIQERGKQKGELSIEDAQRLADVLLHIIRKFKYVFFHRRDND